MQAGRPRVIDSALRRPSRPFLAGYLLLVALGLFLARRPTSPALWDDSLGYLAMAESMALNGCFDGATPARPDMTYDERLNRNNDCFLTMGRPFMTPLLLRVLGGPEAYGSFQNVVGAGAWTFLAATAFALPFALPLRVAGHAALVYFGAEVPTYHDAVLTDDLSLSGWIVLVGILVLALFLRPTPRRARLQLAAFTAVAASLVFVRDSNQFVVLAFAAALHLGVFLRQRLAGGSPRWRAHALAGLVLVAAVGVNQWSIETSERYIQPFGDAILFRLGPEYSGWTPERFPLMYAHSSPDPEWFFERHPELRSLGVPPSREAALHPFNVWLYGNARDVWTGYLVRHPFRFIGEALGYARDNVHFYRFLPFYPWSFRLAGLAVAVAALAPFATFHRSWQLALLVWGVLGVFATEFLFSVAAAHNGDIIRHTHTAVALLSVPMTVGGLLLATGLAAAVRRVAGRRPVPDRRQGWTNPGRAG